MHFLCGGKGYAIFALLFGFTFSLMRRKYVEKGKDFGPRFLWRLILLVGFSLINCAFFSGDILSLYAVLGLTLILVRNWSIRNQMIAAIVLLAQPFEWFHYFVQLTNSGFTLWDPHAHQYWDLLDTGHSGDSLWNLMQINARYGHAVTFWWSLEAGRLTQTAGLLILGNLIGLKGLFTPSKESQRFWNQALIVASISFILIQTLEVNFNIIDPNHHHERNLLRAIDMYGNLAFTCMILSIFWSLYRLQIFRQLIGSLRYPGQMSLTAYVAQSMVGGFVFYCYGLALSPHVGNTLSLMIGALLWSLITVTCIVWLKNYKQGPLERLWHKLTWII
jgi:uncharacterized protein